MGSGVKKSEKVKDAVVKSKSSGAEYSMSMTIAAKTGNVKFTEVTVTNDGEGSGGQGAGSGGPGVGSGGPGGKGSGSSGPGGKGSGSGGPGGKGSGSGGLGGPGAGSGGPGGSYGGIEECACIEISSPPGNGPLGPGQGSGGPGQGSGGPGQGSGQGSGGPGQGSGGSGGGSGSPGTVVPGSNVTNIPNPGSGAYDLTLSVPQTWSQEPAGYSRTAKVSVPATSEGQKVPVVLHLHGNGGQGNTQVLASWLGDDCVIVC